MVEWHPFPDLEGRYEVSRCGKVRSVGRFVASPIIAAGKRWLPSRDIKLQRIRGYLGFVTKKGEGHGTFYVHRAIAKLFVPNPQGKPHVNHIDGNKVNNAPENLEWVTHAENMRHAGQTGLLADGRSGPGEKSPAAKITWDEAREIRKLISEGLTHAEIGLRFGIKKGAVGCIARNETWKVEQ